MPCRRYTRRWKKRERRASPFATFARICSLVCLRLRRILRRLWCTDARREVRVCANKAFFPQKVDVHFCHATKKTMFRLRRNPKKRAWGRPPMWSRVTPNSAEPNSKVCLDGYTPSPRRFASQNIAAGKLLRFFAQSHAALTSQNPCFRRLKEDGENGELPSKRKHRYQTNIFPRSFRLRMTAIFYPLSIPFFPYCGIASEATSLRTFGPHGQKAHYPGGSTRGGPPSYALSLVRFFDARQRNEQQTYYG